MEILGVDYKSKNVTFEKTDFVGLTDVNLDEHTINFNIECHVSPAKVVVQSDPVFASMDSAFHILDDQMCVVLSSLNADVLCVL